MPPLRRIGDVVLIQLSSSDSNIYLLGDTVIDAGTGLNFTRLRDILKVVKIDFKDFKQVVCTHGHFDHVGGAGYFINAQIMVHKGDAPIVESGDNDLAVSEFFDGQLHPKPVHVKLDDGDIIRTSIGDLEVIATPGHTHGSICLYDKARQHLFSGDTVFEHAIGRFDFPNSNVEAMRASLDRLAKLPVKQVFPGHGNLFDKKTLDNTLKISVERFQQLLDEGEVDDDYI